MTFTQEEIDRTRRQAFDAMDLGDICRDLNLAEQTLRAVPRMVELLKQVVVEGEAFTNGGIAIREAGLKILKDAGYEL